MNSSVGRRGVGPGEGKLSRDAKPLVHLIASQRIFLLNDDRQVSRLSCWFCHLHVANLGGSCAQGRANTRGSRAGTADGNISIQKQGRQDMQQLAVLENAARHKKQQKLKSLI